MGLAPRERCGAPRRRAHHVRGTCQGQMRSAASRRNKGRRGARSQEGEARMMVGLHCKPSREVNRERKAGTQSGAVRTDVPGRAGRDVDGLAGEESRAMQQSPEQQRTAEGRRQQAGRSPRTTVLAVPDMGASHDEIRPIRPRVAARRLGRTDRMSGRSGQRGSGTAAESSGRQRGRRTPPRSDYFLGVSLERNLAGSFSKSGLQLLQQSFTSCPW